jgi:hypothetical protein
MYAQAYILYMFGGLNFMSTTSNAVPLFFLTLLE